MSEVQDTAYDDRRTEAIAWLHGRINYERSDPIPYHEQGLKLDRMRDLLRRLDNPEQSLRIVHVAGTKGKGTVGAMISGSLTAAGYKTGLYSSPHLERIEERFAIDGEPCSAERLVALVDRVRPHAEAMDHDGSGPTFFDLTTAMALLHFADQRVGAAVIEVGLGGRLDSTNVVTPAACVVTSISLDHTRQLGETRGAIAAEKGGIIKAGIPVVCGAADDEAASVLEGIAHERGAPFFLRGRDFDCWPSPKGGWGFSRRGPHGEERIECLRPALPGPVHAQNAATALALLGVLVDAGWEAPIEARRRGIEAARPAARMERFEGPPITVIDTAHNAASAEALAGALDALCAPAPRERRVLLLAVSDEKDTDGIVRAFAPCFDRAIVTRFTSNPRSIPPQRLAATLRDVAASLEVTQTDSPEEAYRAAVSFAGVGGAVVVTGSFFLAAELRGLAAGAAADD